MAEFKGKVNLTALLLRADCRHSIVTHSFLRKKVTCCEAFRTGAVSYAVFTSKHINSRSEYQRALYLEPGVGSNAYIFS